MTAGSKAGVLACWIRGNWHLVIGAPVLHMRFAPYKSGIHVFRWPTQVQLMRGEFLETALYWAGVFALDLRLRVIDEKEVHQHSCVRGSE